MIRKEVALFLSGSERREGWRVAAAAAWQLARLALEDHGEGKFDKGGIFSGVPMKHRPTPP
jgi:hypothetical protein